MRLSWSRKPFGRWSAFNCFPTLIHMFETWPSKVNLLTMSKFAGIRSLHPIPSAISLKCLLYILATDSDLVNYQVIFTQHYINIGIMFWANEWLDAHWVHWWRPLQPTSSVITDAKSADLNLDDFARKNARISLKICIMIVLNIPSAAQKKNSAKVL